jgi:Mrp family chromosome partitioning ATPase
MEVLHGECTVEEAILKMEDSGLHVMTAGISGNRTGDPLRNGILRQLFQQLRKRYKYIIIDTPPILSAGESLSFGKVADGTLLCALRDVSRIPRTRKALARLVAAGIRPLGAVLAGVPASAHEAAYNYAYGISESDSEPSERVVR